MKKFLFTLFVTLCSTISWAYDCEIDGIRYNVNGITKEAEVTYYMYQKYENRDYYSGDIVIPETITFKNVDLSVTSIGEYAFYYCSGLTSVTIPNSVTSIGEYAFYYCIYEA